MAGFIQSKNNEKNFGERVGGICIRELILRKGSLD
jgi:hypothetical protein